MLDRDDDLGRGVFDRENIYRRGSFDRCDLLGESNCIRNSRERFEIDQKQEQMHGEFDHLEARGEAIQHDANYGGVYDRAERIGIDDARVEDRFCMSIESCSDGVKRVGNEDVVEAVTEVEQSLAVLTVVYGNFAHKSRDDCSQKKCRRQQQCDYSDRLEEYGGRDEDQYARADDRNDDSRHEVFIELRADGERVQEIALHGRAGLHRQCRQREAVEFDANVVKRIERG